jgi:hypothetical protein
MPLATREVNPAHHPFAGKTFLLQDLLLGPVGDLGPGLDPVDLVAVDRFAPPDKARDGTASAAQM